MPSLTRARVRKRSKRQRSGVRKLKPTALLPTLNVLRGLGPTDVLTLQRRLRETSECVYNVSFRRSRFWEDLPELPPRPPETESVVLTWQQEKDAFQRFNYARYRVLRVLHAHRGERLDAAATRELLRWDGLANEARNRIVDYNTSLVLAMARRAKNSAAELADLVSEGNLALLRCVDKFDVERGFKFSTYACRAILAAFSRAGMKSSRHKTRFPSTFDPTMERSDFLERRRDQIEKDSVADLREILSTNTAALTPVEQTVLGARFSLGQEANPGEGVRGQTLEQVGSLLGVSKERVRQIQNEALGKLRAVIEERLLATS